MAEQSLIWTTSGTPAGDQQASYSQLDFADVQRILAACAGFEGVAPGYLNELACTDGGANTVNVNTGGAVVDGIAYKNDASQAVTVISAVDAGDTRIDRIVLRADWAGFNVSVHLIDGTDAASPTAPAITQTSETTYDIQLCQVLVDTSGNVTVTDERTWATAEVDDSTIEVVQASGALGVKDAGVTAAKIANRTREFLVPYVRSAGTDNALVYGMDMADGVSRQGNYNFVIPYDFSATLMIYPIINPLTASGDIKYNFAIRQGAVGEAYDTHDYDVLNQVEAITASQLNALTGIELTSPTSGDIVSGYFARLGGDAADTLGADVYLAGFLVTYTADS